jgi:hypothetical protein
MVVAKRWAEPGVPQAERKLRTLSDSHPQASAPLPVDTTRITAANALDRIGSAAHFFQANNIGLADAEGGAMTPPASNAAVTAAAKVRASA